MSRKQVPFIRDDTIVKTVLEQLLDDSESELYKVLYQYSISIVTNFELLKLRLIGTYSADSTDEEVNETIQTYFVLNRFLRYQNEIFMLYPDGRPRISLTDSERRTVSRQGNANGMNENSPTNAEQGNIITPFMKSASVYDDSVTETITRDTAKESLTRIRAYHAINSRLYQICESCWRSVIEEYNTAY